MLKPKKLNKGDTIAFVAPSSGLGGLFPHRLDAARNFLVAKGFKVKEFPTTRGFNDGSSGTPEERARDLIAAFNDKEVKAIVCNIGGLSSNELLKIMDFGVIKKNPKIFCGYSDISILHYAFQKKAGLVTFYGPAAMTQFGDNPKTMGYTWEHFLKAVSSPVPVGKIQPSKEWTDEFMDWAGKKDLERPRKLVKNDGWIWIKEGKAQGQVIGGCLSSILKLSGTEFDVSYEDKVLFIETPEGQDFKKGEPLNYVDSQLMDLRNLGIFDRIRGLLVGRGQGYTKEERDKFRQMVIKHTKDYNFPVLMEIDIGHTDPMMTIPLGVEVTLDSEKDIFSIDEAGVVD
jgi:muramoyltetrapeptide carboxypeptidase LdcA involved in peptidoglycan recycling